MQKTLDKTEDEETRESLQANLDSQKQWREEYEKSGKYQISPEQIASYRAFGADQLAETDDDIRLEVVFDNWGRTISTYTTNTDITRILGSSAASYTDTAERSKQNNRLTSVGSTGMTAENLLRDGGLESEDYFCYDGLLNAPKNAEIGQFLKVSGVNGHGIVSQVEAVTIPPLDEAVDTALAQAKESGEFDGASAYEIAQNNGFTGTEAEWLESLKGKFNSNVGNIRLINITGRLTSEPGVIIDFRTTRLRGVRDPQADDDAATRRYVDRAVTGYTVPSYWQEAVDAAAAKVTAKQDAGGMDCVTFALFSDVHAVPDSTTPNSGNTGNLTAAVMDACGVPFAVCCGDVCRTDADTETAARESIAAGAKNLRPIGARKLLQAQGDHDGSYGTAQMSAGAMFGAIFRSQAEDERRHFGGDGSYFYVDDPAAKMRLIVLNSCWTDSAHLRTASFGYGNTQLNWLADTALSFAEDGWCVALFAHVPPVAAYSAQIRDMTVLRGILAAFLNKTSYTGTSGTAGAWDYVSVSCNFTGKHNGKIVGFFCGHSHGDSIVTDETPYPVVTIASDAHSLSADSEVVRTAGTAAEHVIDFVTVNRSAKTVSLTRLGAGEDRSYSYQ